MRKSMLVLCMLAALSMVFSSGCSGDLTGSSKADTGLLGAAIGVAICCNPAGAAIGAGVGIASAIAKDKCCN